MQLCMPMIWLENERRDCNAKRKVSMSSKAEAVPLRVLDVLTCQHLLRIPCTNDRYMITR